MRHIWSVICQSTSIDIRSNNLSIFNIMEHIEFQLKSDKAVTDAWKENQLIPLPISFEFVSFWWRDNDNILNELDVRLVQIFPNKNFRILGESKVDATVQSRVRNIFQVQGIHFAGDGVYLFVLQAKNNETWETITEIPLEIVGQVTI